jgi:hypothetical protein
MNRYVYPVVELYGKKSVILLQDPDNLSNIVRVFRATTDGKARLHTDLLPYYAIPV